MKLKQIKRLIENFPELKCPLCNKKYESYIIARCKGYLAKKTEEREGSLEDRLKNKRMGKIEYVAKNIVFLKNVGMIEELIEKQEFDTAIEQLTTTEWLS